MRWAPALTLAVVVFGCDDGDIGPDPAVDGTIEAGPECVAGARRPCPIGATEQVCVDGLWGPCDPTAEVCDGVDQDGDGVADEGLFEACGSTVGMCSPGLRACADGVWGGCVGAVGPRGETCDGFDEDCDGAVDEAPVLSSISTIQAPTVRGPDRLVWSGRAHAASLPGYPNWLMRFSPDGTVWRTDLYGRVPVTIDLAAGPSGLAMAWAERASGPVFARAGWGDAGLEPTPVGPAETIAHDVRLAGETRSTLIAWVDGDARRPMAQVIDPETGARRFDVMPLGGPEGAIDLTVVNNGEEGFAAAWRIADADEPGAVWFARTDNSGAVMEGFEVVAGDATGAAVLADYYVDAFAVVWTDGQRVRMARIDRGAGRVVSTRDVADGQVGVGGLEFIRDDSTWAAFWSADTEDGRQVRGRLFDRGGEALTDVVDIMPAGERFGASHGGPSGYVFATVRGDRFETRGGPVICPIEGP